ncbi:unnamed protein product [Wickerhamomyces anomalus]
MSNNIQTSSFVKKLAANALEALQKFLSHPRKLPLLEYEKLWKGLYYSMWFSDRPRPQQRLARDLSSLFDIIPKQNWKLFNESWWVIICKEWPHIDHWRLDKFLMLVRFNLNAIKIPLSGDKKIPNGIPFHIIDIYVDELEKVVFKDVEEKDEEEEDEEDEQDDINKRKQDIIDSTPVGELISVFDELSKEAAYKTLREKIRDEVLKDDRLKQWGVVEVVEEENDESEEDTEDDQNEDSEDEWNGFD